jgi:hypothetical protein
MSAGTADNLLILFSCTDKSKIVWAGQVGDFGKDDIGDVNGDGIKDIICNESMMYMGECNGSYRIFTFKNGLQTFLYKAFSKSVLDCGNENLAELYKPGDTLENLSECTLIRKRNTFNIQKISTLKIHNGGVTDFLLLDNLLIKIDTTESRLKRTIRH